MGILKLNKNHRDVARRRSWNDARLVSGRGIEPEDLLAHASAQLKDHGVEIVEKRSGKMITSLVGRLRVPPGWHDKRVAYKAADLAHELVHYRQRKTYGNGWFEIRWASSARMRLALELPAFFEEIAALNAMGMYRDLAHAEMQAIPERIRRDYLMGAMNWSHTKKFLQGELECRFAELPKIRGNKPR